MRTRASLGPIVALLGCHPSPPAHVAPAPVVAPVVAPAVTPAAAVTVTPPAPERAACEASWSATLQAMASLAARVREPDEVGADQGEFDPRADAESPLRTCLPSAAGTWSLVLESLTRPDPRQHRVEGRWALVFTRPDGQRLTAYPDFAGRAAGTPSFVDSMGELSRGPASLVAFDYDGDHVAEAVTVTAEHEHEGPSDARAQVWTVRDGAIVPYAPAAAIDASDVRDVDGDGRPDLLTSLGYEAPATSRGSQFDYILLGPAFMAHATAQGAFAIDDPAALSEADRLCSPAPSSVIVPSEGDFGVDDEQTTRAVICARMRGAAAAPIAAAIRRACARSQRDAAGQRREACNAPAQLIAMARRTPPLHLPPRAATPARP
jgi:hypothetical protein